MPEGVCLQRPCAFVLGALSSHKHVRQKPVSWGIHRLVGQLMCSSKLNNSSCNGNMQDGVRYPHAEGKMPIEHSVRETDLFRALGGDGVIYTIVEYTHVTVEAAFPGDQCPKIIESRKDYCSWPRSISVLPDDAGYFRIATTGVLLKRF